MNRESIQQTIYFVYWNVSIQRDKMILSLKGMNKILSLYCFEKKGNWIFPFTLLEFRNSIKSKRFEQHGDLEKKKN